MVQETALGAFYGLGCIPCPFVIQGVSGAFERRQLWLHYRTGRPVGRWRPASFLLFQRWMGVLYGSLPSMSWFTRFLAASASRVLRSSRKFS